jgi:hypothetical protein
MKCPLLLVYFLSVWLSQGYPARVLAALVVGLSFAPQTRMGVNFIAMCFSSPRSIYELFSHRCHRAAS